MDATLYVSSVSCPYSEDLLNSFPDLKKINISVVDVAKELGDETNNTLPAELESVPALYLHSSQIVFHGHKYVKDEIESRFNHISMTKQTNENRRSNDETPENRSQGTEDFQKERFQSFSDTSSMMLNAPDPKDFNTTVDVMKEYENLKNSR